MDLELNIIPNFIGINRDNEKFQNFLSKKTYSHKIETKEFQSKGNPSEIYYSSFEYGFSFNFINETLTNIFLYGNYDKKFKCFAGILPYNLNFEFNCEDVVSRFGEPYTKTGGDLIPITVSYDSLGLEITFCTNNWIYNKAVINFICIFNSDKSEKKKICGICKKFADNFCGKCKLVKYCSVECQRIHWKIHKKFCLIIN